jgi:hypothetical protein
MPGGFTVGVERFRLPRFVNILAIAALCGRRSGYRMAFISLPRRPVALLMISTVLTACSAEGLVPPASIDGTTRVGAIQPSREPARQAYPANGVASAGSAMHMNDGTYREPQLMSAPTQQPLPRIDSEEAMGVSSASNGNPGNGSLGVLRTSQDGVNMDAMLGVEPVTGLAEEQQNQIGDNQLAEGMTNQPVVDGIGTDNPVQTSGNVLPAGWGMPSRAAASPRPQSSGQPVQDVAMLMPQNPAQSNRSSAPPGMMPQSEVACRSELRRLGVSFRDVARIADGPTCGIDYPLELNGLASGVAIKPAVKLNCQVTLAFAKWVKFELVPSSRFRYMSGVGRITPMGGYSCRKMNSRASNPWSEHAKGNAIDIGTITLKNGKEIDVRKKGFFAFREKGLLKAVRSDSCKYFSTVLGPGSDKDHWNHFHFDLRTRKSGYRHCD